MPHVILDVMTPVREVVAMIVQVAVRKVVVVHVEMIV